jgi:uncharacterized membrane protein
MHDDTLPSPLGRHVDDTVEAIASVHREHELSKAPLDRLMDRVTAEISRPWVAALLFVVLMGWVGANLTSSSGATAIEGPALAWLELTAAIAALLLTVLILSSQRRADTLAERRADLTLELAMLNDKKSAKIIALLEELRHDHPQIENRVDSESEAMAQETDPEAVLSAIEQQRPTRAAKT